jgi:hypothetical protein
LLLLAQHPQVALQLLDELRSKMSRASPSLSDAGELSYLDAVVRESMRILPPVPFQIHVAGCDTKIFGYPPPRGTRVILDAFLTNRMPYPPIRTGTCFDPNDGSRLPRPRLNFPVFSGGPHGCPGYWFGSPAVKIALTAILTRYRLVLAPDTRIATAFSQPCGRCSACTHFRCRRMARLQQRRSAQDSRVDDPCAVIAARLDPLVSDFQRRNRLTKRYPAIAPKPVVWEKTVAASSWRLLSGNSATVKCARHRSW